jgi:hypothetical protein
MRGCLKLPLQDIFPENNKSLFTPEFKINLQEKTEKIGIATKKELILKIFSRPHPRFNWQEEYYKVLDYNYPAACSFISETMDFVKRNYYLFRRDRFSKIMMFSFNGVMFNEPEMIYDEKILKGKLILRDLSKYLDYIHDEISIDLLANQNNIIFYEAGVAVLIGDYLYIDGECRLFEAPVDLALDAILEEIHSICPNCEKIIINNVHY